MASCVKTGPLKPDPQGHFRVPGGYPVSLPHLLRWAPLSSPRDLQETEAQRAGQAFLLPQKVPGPSRSAPQTQVACGLGPCPSVTLGCGSPSRGPESPCARFLLPASVSPGGCCPGAGPHMSRSSPASCLNGGRAGMAPAAPAPSSAWGDRGAGLALSPGDRRHLPSGGADPGLRAAGRGRWPLHQPHRLHLRGAPRGRGGGGPQRRPGRPPAHRHGQAQR